MNYPGVDFLLPHQTEGSYINTKEFFKSGQCSLFMAEVSCASFGLGMELAYADMFNIPTVCFYKVGINVSSSVRNLGFKMVSYNDMADLKSKISSCLLSLPL